ncbi:hypothetical protein C1H76_0727 [Elsinoe australis]|uniref:Uncharacterized protein n=1 Tax=Elsinoe australis TaxID=40998 RepID=A0A4U7B6B3_9PEZI|nr:hypothetical protein C1H76_0727 [Elsinoe australis]
MDSAQYYVTDALRYMSKSRNIARLALERGERIDQGHANPGYAPGDNEIAVYTTDRNAVDTAFQEYVRDGNMQSDVIMPWASLTSSRSDTKSANATVSKAPKPIISADYSYASVESGAANGRLADQELSAGGGNEERTVSKRKATDELGDQGVKVARTQEPNLFDVSITPSPSATSNQNSPAATRPPGQA